VKSLAAFPIIDREQHLLGVLFLCYQLPQRFPDSEMYLLAAYADQLAIALEDAQLYEETERRRHESEVLSDLGRTLNASLDLGMVLQRVAEGAKDLCGSDLAAIALRDPRSGAMVFRHWPGAQDPKRQPLRVQRGKGAGGHVLVTGRPFRTMDYGEDPRVGKEYASAAEPEGVRAAMVVPIRIEDQVEGLLYVGNRSSRPLTDQDEAILTRLADHAAIAIQNARLYEEATRRRREAEELARVARTLTESLDVSEVGQRVVENLVPLFGARSAALRLLRPDGTLIALFTAGPGGTHSGPGHVLPAGMGVSGRVIAANGPLHGSSASGVEDHPEGAPDSRGGR
jgi:GAF domain-containing protein